MQRALLVAVVVGIACAVLSCWLTLLGWSLMGDAVSHAVLPGVVLSYVIGAPFAAGAFIFGAGAVGLIGGLNRTSRVKEDAAIGIVFTGLFALGLVLVSVIPSQTDLFHILFGNVLGVSDADIVQVVRARRDRDRRAAAAAQDARALRLRPRARARDRDLPAAAGDRCCSARSR